MRRLLTSVIVGVCGVGGAGCFGSHGTGGNDSVEQEPVSADGSAGSLITNSDAGDMAGVPAVRQCPPRVLLDERVGSNTDCSLDGRPDLDGRNFAMCDLDRTEISETSLVGVDFTCAGLEGVNLTRSDLSAATLRDAQLAGLTASEAKFVAADFSGATIINARLWECDFTTANLSSVRLEGAALFGSDFTGANLTDSNLRSAYLAAERGVGGAAAILTDVIWANTTCPDSTNSDDNGGTCEGHLGF